MGMERDASRIIRECYRRHQPLPKSLTEAPALIQGLGLFFDAFCELDSCRQVGMGIGSIPWSVVQDYAITNEFTMEQTEDLHYFIQKMDQAYRSRVASQSKAKSPKKP